MITGADLALVGFEWYDGVNSGDPCCQAYYQRDFDTFHVEVAFYVWHGGEVQPNLKIERYEGFQENVELIGVPSAWTVTDLLLYCQQVIRNFEEAGEKFGYERINSLREMLTDRIEGVKNGTVKTISHEEFKTRRKFDSARRLRERIQNADVNNDEDFERILNDVVDLTEMSDKDIAHRFSVSHPTVERWRGGKTSPGPAFLPTVYQWLQQQLDNKFKQKEEPTS
jgi:hypothetical protein